MTSTLTGSLLTPAQPGRSAGTSRGGSAAVRERIDHYSLLRTLEEMYGVPPLGQAADAQPLAGIWTDAQQ
jgi:hypothetical protein